jgi:hypothetical protein
MTSYNAGAAKFYNTTIDKISMNTTNTYKDEHILKTNILKALVAWGNGNVSACGVMGREIESHR